MIKPTILSPFKHFCVTIGEIPSSYLESMTYYELLNWFCDYLQNTVIPAVNTNSEAVEELQTLFVELKNYVDNYFSNLDVQEEINNKLDEMAESGQLTDIIAQYLGLAGMIAFDNVNAMKEAQNLVNGSKCRTLGFYSVNDNGGAYYKIRNITNDDVIDEKTLIAVYDDLLVAELIKDETINVKQLGAYGDGVHDDKLTFETALSLNNGVIIPSGTYLLSGLTIPDNKNLIGYDDTTLIITNTINMGYNSTLKGDIKVDGTQITTAESSLIQLAKWCIVDIYSIEGYREEGASKGATTVSKGIDATYSDFVKVHIKRITKCKYAFYINAGVSGSGNTINDSDFICEWIGDCYYGYYQAGSNQTQIVTNAYIEYCNVGYSLRDSFYGIHTATFDNVDTNFENRNQEYRSRMGYVFLPNISYTDFVNGTDRYFQSTTFYLQDCTIYPKSRTDSNIKSWVDSKLFLQSGKSKIRMTSSESITYEGKESDNDTSGGITATLGNSGKFSVENESEKLIFSISGASGETINRTHINIGDSDLGYYNVRIQKGSVEFINPVYNPGTNAPNNSIFVDYSDNKLKFKDHNGTIKEITTS